MRIVVASGKGGTGKTTVSTSLAQVATERDAVRFLDCDVEAPNAALFLHPVLDSQREVGIRVPRVDADACTYCGRCAEVCQFHAIAVVGQKTLVFDDLCHGCGSCAWMCPEQAISETLSVTGVIDSGTTPEGIAFAQGVMNVGQTMGVPILRELKKWTPARLPEAPGAPRRALEILDAPPGASCPVVETLRGADLVLLVTEPTPFGLHDLKQVVAIARELGIPAGVVINRDGIGDDAVGAWCAESGLPILLRIPMERRIAEAIAGGRTLVDAAPEYRPGFRDLLERLVAGVNP
ncbi:ATP-binding protein [Thiocystis violacea]|uniref:ATP-binding protein n=1 Tax=Thiocystis violacea TaxID=13725 RepID=UPI001904CCDE|nr:ATP-binding protein [Thiocystis violacea]MBK1717363.1 (4Fe-4S)-binding protein [Thiocystis violacea]